MLLPLHRILPFPQSSQKDNTPSLCTTSLPFNERSVCFASLRNSGRSTSGIHARPLSKVRCCRPIKFGQRPEGLPHHQLCLAPTPSKTALSHSLFVMPTSVCADMLSHPHYPLPRTKLASLVKGRWIDGKAQTLTLLHLLAICPPFLYCKLFCRQDGGIATPTAPFPFL